VTKRKATTLEEVAAVAGVSRATVSRVVNNTPTVDPALRDVVMRAVRQTGYVPNRAARSLVTRRTDSIGLVASEVERRVFTDPFFGTMVRGVMDVVRKRGVQLVLLLAEDEPARRQLLGYLHAGHLDGVIMISTHVGDSLPRVLTEEGLPAVLSARPTENIPISYVDTDSRGGAAMAVDHLVAACGRRVVATVSGPLDMPAGQDRLAGYHDSLRRHHLPVRRKLVEEGNFDRESGERAMAALLDRRPDIDGVFVASDLMAQGALAALRRAGRRVPDDVAVVGFDDSEVALDTDPPLTTIRQPLEDMARMMATILLDRIADPDLPVVQEITPTQLVRRASA
jgi:DNA-binding LacI/PurR family transcriptional regulator